VDDDGRADAGPVEGYDLLEPLGRGGMGEVYRARDRACDREVALKVLPEATSARAAERFRREVAAAARLDHPNLVPVHTAGTTRDGRPFYAMQLVDGPTLGEAAAAGLTPRAAARVVARLARALEHAHRKGVVHRDLKPGNVIVDERGEPRLIDFGLALVRGYPQVTSPGAVLGTPSYLAPEIARGEVREAGRSVDVYGLGAILYELLAGEPPWAQVTSLPALLDAIRSRPPTPPSAARGEPLPPEVEAVCARALATDPGERYPGCGELARDLEGWLGEASAPASAPGERSGRLLLLGGGLALAAAAAALGAWALSGL